MLKLLFDELAVLRGRARRVLYSNGVESPLLMVTAGAGGFRPKTVQIRFANTHFRFFQEVVKARRNRKVFLNENAVRFDSQLTETETHYGRITVVDTICK